VRQVTITTTPYVAVLCRLSTTLVLLLAAGTHMPDGLVLRMRTLPHRCSCGAEFQDPHISEANLERPRPLGVVGVAWFRWNPVIFTNLAIVQLRSYLCQIYHVNSVSVWRIAAKLVCSYNDRVWRALMTVRLAYSYENSSLFWFVISNDWLHQLLWRFDNELAAEKP